MHILVGVKSMRWQLLALAVIIAAAAVAAILYVYTGASGGHEEAPASKGLLVIVTMPGFEEDVRKLLCSDDEVYVLVPPGVDPHSYELTPKDVSRLSRASIIVSTAHTHFERRIAELVAGGELRATLIEIPKVVKLFYRNPDTGQLNYHAVLYDPRNLMELLRAVAGEASKLRPECAAQYSSRLQEVVSELRELMGYTNRFNISALGEGPGVQYAVEWLGIHLVLLIQPEHGVQPDPGIIRKAETLVSEGKVKAVVVIEGSTSPAASFLRDLANRYNLAIIEVPSPLKPGSIVDKLEAVVDEVEGILER